jgi:toxin ParE1/3/4
MGGESKFSQYLDYLNAQFWALTENPLMGVERPELLFEMRCFPVESHVVFYRVEMMKVEIIRVLHGRQDPQRKIN